MARSAGVVGAGVLGRLVAWRLLREGWRVTLFDRGDREGRSGCSWAGAGMLTPWAELEKAEPVIGELGRRSLHMWPELLAQLPQPVFFQVTGSLVVAHRQDYGDLTAFARHVAPKLPEARLMRELDGAGVAEVEPELGGRFHRGLFFEEEGQLEPRQLLPALGRALDEARVIWREDVTVTDVAPCEVVIDQEHERFDWVIDTRGLGAKPQAPDLRGVRGELLRLHAPEVRLTRPVRLAHPRYPLYITPRPDDVYLVGATSIESEDHRPITVKSSLELLSAAYSLHPGFAEATVLESVVDLRPAFSDNLPHRHLEWGLMRINGLYRHGFLIAPAVAQDAVDALITQSEEHHAQAHA